jgi:hypothetical protein
MKELDYKQLAINLWSLLDDIDTADDVAKGNDTHFRKLALSRVRTSKNLLKSDGYDLFTPEGLCLTSEGKPYPEPTESTQIPVSS